MKKIIHLSDLHIGNDDMLKRMNWIIKMIEFRKPEAENYVIIITGDLTESPKSENYENVKRCIDYLRNKKYTVLPLPGNHDYARGVWHSSDFVSKFKEAFFEKDSDFFSTYEGQYPKVDIIDNIAFLGLDSMEKELDGLDSLMADGELGDAQLTRLNERLKKDVVKNAEYKVIYLHHHPFAAGGIFHGLKDSEKLKSLINNYIAEDPEKHKINALLNGHNHIYGNWNGQLGVPRCYDGGSSTGKKARVSQIKHRVIDLSKDPLFDYDGDFLRGYKKEKIS